MVRERGGGEEPGPLSPPPVALVRRAGPVRFCLAANLTGLLFWSVAAFRGTWRVDLLLRQRRGIPDRHRAARVADQPVAVRAERQAIDLPARFEVEKFL